MKKLKIIKVGNQKQVNDSWHAIQLAAKNLSLARCDDWLQYSRQKIKVSFKHHFHIYNMYLNNKVIGTISIRPTPIDCYYRSDIAKFSAPKRPAYFFGFCIIPELQGQGYAKTLLEYAEKECVKQGYTAFRCDARNTRLPHTDFYIKNGYRVVGLSEDQENYSLSEKELS